MPNVLDPQFEADRPNQKWVADFSYIWTTEAGFTLPPSSMYSRAASSPGRRM